MSKRRELLFDTGVLFDVYKGRERVHAYFKELLDGSVEGCLSVISETEMWRGLRPGEEETHRALVELFTVLPLYSEAARLAGQWMRQYQSQSLGWMDALIVATAHQTGITTLTHDARLAATLAGQANFETY